MPNFSRCPKIRLALWVASALIAPGPARSGDRPEASPPIPPLNAKVAEFARSHVGAPVGDGICVTLAVEALRASGAKRFPFVPSGDYVWGEPVPDMREVLPGDILQFRDAEFVGSRSLRGRKETWHETYPHHTAVVVATAEKGRLITICHQNIALQGDDPSKIGNVRESTLRMNSLQKGGTIRAFRPVPRETSPSFGSSFDDPTDY